LNACDLPIAWKKMRLPDPVKGAVSFLSYFSFTIVICTFILLIALLKFLMPLNFFQKAFNRVLNALVDAWILCGILTHDLIGNTEWQVSGIGSIHLKQWCLILVNHQSWVDIPVLMKVFYLKIPPFKFFVKHELLWLPFIGLSAWAMDFPFMKRYSKEFLKKNPGLKGKDIEATRKACEKFTTNPVSIFNFVEGTRYTEKKHDRQQSPYKHLLKPKSGGAALVLYAMGDYLKQIINVTIVYLDGIPGLWDFFCGRVKNIVVDVSTIPVDKDLIGNYYADDAFKDRFQEWLNGLWKEKDAAIEAVLEKQSTQLLSGKGFIHD
jgi:1-acyl-sn-glycerol-3-phosphate acyltransferase